MIRLTGVCKLLPPIVQIEPFSINKFNWMIPPDLIPETNKVILRPVEQKDDEIFLQISQLDADMYYYSGYNLGDKVQLINRHAKFAMMNYAFEQLNFERVEFKTDVQNERTRKGLQNVGGIEERILRSHMTMCNNRRRTSIYYSVLKEERRKLKETIFADIRI